MTNHDALELAQAAYHWSLRMAEFDDSKTAEEWRNWLREGLVGEHEPIRIFGPADGD